VRDAVIDFMKSRNIPLTRDNYLDFAYLGNPPEELDAEEESQIPKALLTDEDEAPESE
jgi:hypothetical protein